MKPAFRRSFLLTLALSSLGGATLFADQPIVGTVTDEVVVKTPESIEEGKKNVVSVAQQLRDMFQPIKKRTRNVEEQPPYLRVIPTTEDKSILIYRCRYAKASKLLNSVEAMVSDTGYVEYGEEQNLLTIKDSTENVEAIAKTLPSLDIASPQVLIEAKIVEILISDDMQRNLSFAFNSPTTISMIDPETNGRYDGDTMSSGGISTTPFSSNTSDGAKTNWTFAAGHNNFNLALQWLLTAQDARVLSSPVIVVARNEEAEISNGQDVPIQSQTITNGSISTSTTFKRVGVTLTVEPLMINNDNVTLKVEPEVSNIQSYQTITQSDGGSYQVPVISIRSISSFLRLADGQIVIMGGLYNNRNSVQQERIPFLSDIPYLGELFTSKYTEKEILQLLFFLRVRILTPNDMADGVLFDPEELIKTTNDIGDTMRASEELPKLETSVKKMDDEFIKNPLVSWKDLFGTKDDASTKAGAEKSATDAGETASEKPGA